MEEIRKVKEKYGLTHELNLYIYVPPGNPLTVYIYLTPSGNGSKRKRSTSHSGPTKEELLKVDGFHHCN